MSEKRTPDSAPVEAYDRVAKQLAKAEDLLREIQQGKHSIPGLLVQIERYFNQRGREDHNTEGKP